MKVTGTHSNQEANAAEATKPPFQAKPTFLRCDDEAEAEEEEKKKNDEEVGIVEDGATPAGPDKEPKEEVILKIPALTWYYWTEKMTATTFGETFADLFSQTLGLGYGATSGTLMAIFLVCLGFQLYVKRYVPPLFWAVMATSNNNNNN
jgi:Repeat of Unknown Function (DUF347)